MAEYDMISKTALLRHLDMAIECKDCPRNTDRKTYYDRCGCSEVADICNTITDFATFADVQPVKHGWWITKAEDYYKTWQDSDRSWDDMPYFITGKHIACSECFTEYDVCTEGIEHWIGCPCCLAKMDGEQND